MRRWLTRPQATVLDPRFGFVQRPGTRILQSREGWGEYVANSQGFLDGELAPGRGGIAGVLVGDSFGQGLQVPYGKRFSEVAETEVPGLSLLDAAEAGRSPIHYALFMPRLQQAFHAGFVVVQLNDGDLSELESADLWREALDEFHCAGGAAAAMRPKGHDRNGWLGSFMRESGMLNMLNGRVAELRLQERARLASKLSGRSPDLTDVVARPVTPRAAALMDSLIGVIRAVTPNVVLLYVPHLRYFTSPPEVAYPPRRAFYHALAARLGLPLVDPSDAMLAAYRVDQEPLHGFVNTRPGAGHINERGHAIVGRLLAAEIRRERHPGGPLATSTTPGGERP